jgi:multicomponent Na+:H+ antiporter subunit C
METAITILTGLFFATAIYLMLSRHIIRILLGVAILGNAVNLTIFTNGRITREVPPIIPDDAVVPWRRSPIRCRRRSC